MKKLLKCYPFARLNPEVELVEGFLAYDGVLGDEKSKTHKGIDYARFNEEGGCIGFDVFSAHDGEVFQGTSKRGWGRFVLISKAVGKKKFRTVYAHLGNIDKEIPFLPKEGEKRKSGFVISEARFLGKAGITGWTKRKVQLHFELQQKNKDGEWKKVDPYGIYARASSRKYPQPGWSLGKIKHYWATDRPSFADEV